MSRPGSARSAGSRCPGEPPFFLFQRQGRACPGIERRPPQSKDRPDTPNPASSRRRLRKTDGSHDSRRDRQERRHRAASPRHRNSARKRSTSCCSRRRVRPGGVAPGKKVAGKAAGSRGPGFRLPSMKVNTSVAKSVDLPIARNAGRATVAKIHPQGDALGVRRPKAQGGRLGGDPRHESLSKGRKIGGEIPWHHPFGLKGAPLEIAVASFPVIAEKNCLQRAE